MKRTASIRFILSMIMVLFGFTMSTLAMASAQDNPDDELFWTVLALGYFALGVLFVIVYHLMRRKGASAT